jgi:hypothetical protein
MTGNWLKRREQNLQRILDELKTANGRRSGHLCRAAAQETRRIQDHLRGRANEDKVFTALEEPGVFTPDWFQGVERPSDKQDLRGIDLIVKTRDVGKIFIQIKSSIIGMNRFLVEHPRTRLRIGIIIVSRNDTAEEIRQKVFGAAGLLRDKWLRKRTEHTTP